MQDARANEAISEVEDGLRSILLFFKLATRCVQLTSFIANVFALSIFIITFRRSFFKLVIINASIR